MDKPAPVHLKEMYSIIRYVLSTENHGLKFKPTKGWSWLIKAYSDSDYATDKETRRSIYGYFVYFLSSPNCMEEQRDEKCGAVNCRARIHSII